MKATIKELEKRRDQAIKEIKMLKLQLHKELKKTAALAKVSAAEAPDTQGGATATKETQ